MNRMIIIEKYVKSALIPDLLALIPLFVNLNPSYSSIESNKNYLIECLIFCKIVTFRNI